MQIYIKEKLIWSIAGWCSILSGCGPQNPDTPSVGYPFDVDNQCISSSKGVVIAYDDHESVAMARYRIRKCEFDENDKIIIWHRSETVDRMERFIPCDETDMVAEEIYMDGDVPLARPVEELLCDTAT